MLIPCRSERLRIKDIHQSMKNPRRRLYNFHVRRRDERNSFLLNLFAVFKRVLLACPLSLFLSLYNNTLVFFNTPYLYHSLSYMPHSPQPYPSFTLVMSSAPFAANDNMRLPAYRTSHLARFHPYSRAHPSLHQERLMVRLSTSLLPSSRSTTPTRLQWIVIFLSLLGAVFEAWPQSR